MLGALGFLDNLIPGFRDLEDALTRCGHWYPPVCVHTGDSYRRICVPCAMQCDSGWYNRSGWFLGAMKTNLLETMAGES